MVRWRAQLTKNFRLYLPGLQPIAAFGLDCVCAEVNGGFTVEGPISVRKCPYLLANALD